MSRSEAPQGRRTVPAPSSPEQVLAKVRQHLAQLSKLMSTPDAARLVLGLLYLSRAPHSVSKPGVPTWSWLSSRPARPDSGIHRAVGQALAHCLPTFGARDSDRGVMSLVPVPPAASDALLHSLIEVIGSTRQVGLLLDQCLRDLSTAQTDGSRYFTPRDMAHLMVGAVVPHDRHRVLDPACGSGGLLVETHRYVSERVGVSPALSLQGREQHTPTSQVAAMNLALRAIEARFLAPGDSLTEPEPELHDIILANLPFNQRDWAPYTGAGLDRRRPASPVPVDSRWPEGPPPRGSANSAWIQHIAHALAPGGRAAFLMADTVAGTRQAAAQRLRERLLRDDQVECLIALPPRVFGHARTNTACLWVLNKDKSARPGWGTRDRRRQVLFINARRAFEPVPGSRARMLGGKNAALILETLATWRGLFEDGAAAAPYADRTGWSRSCSSEEIADNGFSLMPTSYAWEPPSPEQDTRDRIDRLKFELADQFDRMHDLELRLLDALEEI
ncbi:N-6 DNA methylase [Streptomyces sp. NPDC060198]|uniref:N-6 DNA methylase n=1 Tax=Streptomyces sp. NPDC060198 TaxID=3347070 RepID=UPI003657254E